jgi:hypothetical protein
MGRYVRAGMILLMGLLMFPFLKTFFDTFTNPTTGFMVTSGYCSADLIALAGFIPWAVPIITLIIAVYIIIKPEQHPEGNIPNE